MELVIFSITALIAVVGALAMLLSKNAVHSALFLLLNFAAIAVLFLLLQSPFLFTIQITVYAGAIMVLFLFVVMLLGVENVDLASTDRFGWQRPLAFALGAVLIALGLVTTLRGVAVQPAQDPAQVAVFGEPAALGATLFTTYMLPFQITGIILLVAVIGVVVLNQRARFARSGKLEG